MLQYYIIQGGECIGRYERLVDAWIFACTLKRQRVDILPQRSSVNAFQVVGRVKPAALFNRYGVFLHRLYRLRLAPEWVTHRIPYAWSAKIL